MRKKETPEYFGGVDPAEEAMLAEIARIEGYSERLFNPGTEKFIKECQEDHSLVLEGRIVLILGIGPGATLPIWTQHKPERIIGLDSNVRILQTAAEKANEMGWGERVSLLEGKVQDLNTLVDPASIDAVVGRQIWHFVPTAQQAQIMEQVRGVLKPGGDFIAEEIILDTWDLRPPCEAHRKLVGWFNQLYERMETNRNMGEALDLLCQEAGLAVVHRREYSTSTEEVPESKIDHEWILVSAGKGMMKMGIVSQEEFNEALEEFKIHLYASGTNIAIPLVQQRYAVKQA